MENTLTKYDLNPDRLYISDNATVCATIRGGSDCRIKYMFRHGVHGAISLDSDTKLYMEILNQSKDIGLANAIYNLLG